MNPDSAAGRSSRRAFLAAVGGVMAGDLTATAGCLGRGEEAPTVSTLAAGSLQRTLTIEFGAPDGTRIEAEAYGSARVVRTVDDDQYNPDIVALADPASFGTPLSVPWYATFANNAFVVACDPQMEGGTRVTGVASWPDALLDDAVGLGRADPDLDLLDCRTRFALALATDRYDWPVFTAGLLHRDRIYPETQLLTQLDAGGVDAAFVYRSVAVERDHLYLELPAAINLNDLDHVSMHATVSYMLPGGVIVRDGSIRYAATRYTDMATARPVFEVLVGTAGDFLEPSGSTVHASHPYCFGDAPPTV